MTHDTAQTCDGCLEGTLRPSSYQRSVKHGGVEGAIEQRMLQCTHCGMETFGQAELTFNRKALVAFQLGVQGIPPAKVREMRLKAGLTSEAAGELFGGGEKAFSKYENAQLVPDASMRSLLLLAIHFPDTVDRLKALKGGTYAARMGAIASHGAFTGGEAGGGRTDFGRWAKEEVYAALKAGAQIRAYPRAAEVHEAHQQYHHAFISQTSIVRGEPEASNFIVDLCPVLNDKIRLRYIYSVVSDDNEVPHSRYFEWQPDVPKRGAV